MSAVTDYERGVYASSAYAGELRLGTIEKDASGGHGHFDAEDVRGSKILRMFLQEDFNTVLDVGAGALEHARILSEAGKTVDTIDYGTSDYAAKRKDDIRVRQQYVRDFNDAVFPELYDAVWCSHMLEHQLNPNIFLKKLFGVVKEGGIVAVVVPPRKPFIVDGHVSLWNAGLVLYHFVLAGNDCSQDVQILQYDYNIGVIVRKRSIPTDQWPKDLCMDTGDLKKLSKFFPADLKIAKNSNGDIFKYPHAPRDSLKIAILIPARFNSSRFPGKALHRLNGVPMAELVYNRCRGVGFDTFLVSDDERICKLVAHSVMTEASCENGTARCAQAAKELTQYDAFINVQGDMPDITVDIIQEVARALLEDELVTAYTTMLETERRNPNSVKLIHNGRHAIWSCRAALNYGDHHLGIYGYRKHTLASYETLPECKAERDEGLEQLRWLNAGYRMRAVPVEFSGIEINSPGDAELWEAKNGNSVHCA